MGTHQVPTRLDEILNVIRTSSSLHGNRKTSSTTNGSQDAAHFNVNLDGALRNLKEYLEQDPSLAQSVIRNVEVLSSLASLLMSYVDSIMLDKNGSRPSFYSAREKGAPLLIISILRLLLEYPVRSRKVIAVFGKVEVVRHLILYLKQAVCVDEVEAPSNEPSTHNASANAVQLRSDSSVGILSDVTRCLKRIVWHEEGAGNMCRWILTPPLLHDFRQCLMSNLNCLEMRDTFAYMMSYGLSLRTNTKEVSSILSDFLSSIPLVGPAVCDVLVPLIHKNTALIKKCIASQEVRSLVTDHYDEAHTQVLVCLFQCHLEEFSTQVEWLRECSMYLDDYRTYLQATECIRRSTFDAAAVSKALNRLECTICKGSSAFTLAILRCHHEILNVILVCLSNVDETICAGACSILCALASMSPDIANRMVDFGAVETMCGIIMDEDVDLRLKGITLLAVVMEKVPRCVSFARRAIDAVIRYLQRLWESCLRRENSELTALKDKRLEYGALRSVLSVLRMAACHKMITQRDDIVSLLVDVFHAVTGRLSRAIWVVDGNNEREGCPDDVRTLDSLSRIITECIEVYAEKITLEQFAEVLSTLNRKKDSQNNEKAEERSGLHDRVVILYLTILGAALAADHTQKFAHIVFFHMEPESNESEGSEQTYSHPVFISALAQWFDSSTSTLCSDLAIQVCMLPLQVYGLHPQFQRFMFQECVPRFMAQLHSEHPSPYALAALGRICVSHTELQALTLSEIPESLALMDHFLLLHPPHLHYIEIDCAITFLCSLAPILSEMQQAVHSREIHTAITGLIGIIAFVEYECIETTQNDTKYMNDLANRCFQALLELRILSAPTLVTMAADIVLQLPWKQDEGKSEETPYCSTATDVREPSNVDYDLIHDRLLHFLPVINGMACSDKESRMILLGESCEVIDRLIMNILQRAPLYEDITLVTLYLLHNLQSASLSLRPDHIAVLHKCREDFFRIRSSIAHQISTGSSTDPDGMTRLILTWSDALATLQGILDEHTNPKT